MRRTNKKFYLSRLLKFFRFVTEQRIVMGAPHSRIIVDDSNICREATGLLLKNTGYNLYYAKDALEAIGLAVDKKPDLFIIDIILGNGLYLSKRAIEILGGTISVKSQLGKGCTFSIELPKQVYMLAV